MNFGKSWATDLRVWGSMGFSYGGDRLNEREKNFGLAQAGLVGKIFLLFYTFNCFYFLLLGEISR